jgi:membrane protein DedA with SNARE-associated domain/rhodanese-related sulfurtransferase
MEALVSAIAQHGYSLLFFFVFIETIGLPVPAALALLVAGAASAKGPLLPGFSLLIALTSVLTGDTLMFLMGRWTGWWLLGLLCRVSLNPEGCILRSADTFYKRGRLMLVFAKFVPGFSTIAPPMAGSMNMRLMQFLPLDLAGASLYISVYFGAGFLFSDSLGLIAKSYAVFGNTLGWTIALLFAGYIGYRGWLMFRARKLRPVPRIAVSEVARRLHELTIYDARSHGYYDKGATRIPGSSRLEPNALTTEAAKLPRDREIVVYCTCIREATSIRVARILAEEHGLHASVIAGGFRAWKKAGLPLEPVPADDIVSMPTFS